MATTTKKKSRIKDQASDLQEFVRETPVDQYGQPITTKQHEALCKWLPQPEGNDALSDF